MAVNASLINYETLRSLAFGSISGTYAEVGSSVDVPIRMLIFSNTTNEDIIVSFDGINDNTIVPATSGLVLDYCANRSDQAGMAEQSINTPIYVKAPNGNPSSGSFYATVIWVNTRR